MRSAVLLAFWIGSIAVADDSRESGEDCKCVVIYDCPNYAPASHGEGKIIFRLDEEKSNPCPSFSERMCCPLMGGQAPLPSTARPERIAHLEDSETPPPPKSGCGRRNRGGIKFRIEEATNMVAQFAEFPWMVMVFNESTKGGHKALIAGGSLIHERVVITAAHKIINLNLKTAGVRAGEWDLGNPYELVEHQDVPILKTFIHEEFNSDYLFNDIALIVTTRPFKFTRNVGIVCLPKANDIVNSNFCIANGWGKNSSGYYQQILKKIEIPTVPRSDCETKVRSWSTDYSTFSLHNSVTCAGGIENRDTCEGDGGGPLTCPVDGDPSRSQLTGITSWGLSCGASYPAFYTNVAHMRPWIDKQMIKLGFSMMYNY